MMIHLTGIAGVNVVEVMSFSDHRGSFTRLFCERELAHILNGRRIVQINQSLTLAVGTVRGMHYQLPPHAEMKLVRCLRGRVWDVAVDLRASSPTFLKYHAEELSPANRRMLVIPEGCAHGFQTLEPESELLYLHTASYTPDAEAGICHDDCRLRIAWPLAVADLSQRDRNYLQLEQTFSGIEL